MKQRGRYPFRKGRRGGDNEGNAFVKGVQVGEKVLGFKGVWDVRLYIQGGACRPRESPPWGGGYYKSYNSLK